MSGRRSFLCGLFAAVAVPSALASTLPAKKIQTVSDMKALGLPLDAQQVLELIEMEALR